MASLGPQFIVNSTLDDYQYFPAITALSTGGFVATWQSNDNGDGFGTCIRARLNDADGTALGSDFIVNSTAQESQGSPATTALFTGGFVATWESGDTGDGSGGCIRARIYDADGAALGSDFIVNSTTEDDQNDPAITALSTGGFVTTWFSWDNGDGSGTCIRARLYDADGAALGSDFIVNSTTAGYQYPAAITALSTGGFVATWNSEDTGDGSRGCIRARMYDADGVALGPDFIVNSTTEDDQNDPAITALSTGGFVATWSSFGDGNVRARMYDADGTALGKDFIVNSTTEFSEYRHVPPAITALSTGGFVATWQSSWYTGDGSGNCIKAIIVNADRTGVTINGTADEDTITGSPFDDKLAGRGLNDLIYAGDGKDFVTGGAGKDVLYGGAGRDSLKGGVDADTLVGGWGADTLTGGSGADIFKFMTVSEGGDKIMDFEGAGVAGRDRIDLRVIDAILGTPHGDSFVFGGTTATTHGVWYAISGGVATVFADTDGNAATAEFTITVASSFAISTLIEGDFVL